MLSEQEQAAAPDAGIPAGLVLTDGPGSPAGSGATDGLSVGACLAFATRAIHSDRPSPRHAGR